jgi:hypothetical protein
MEETSTQILLAEYDRLTRLEVLHIERCGRVLQLYLTVITAVAGVFLVLFENQVPLGTLRISAGLALGGSLLLGEITFLRLLTEDIAIVYLLKRYRLIQEKFIQIDSKLSDAFPERLAQNTKRMRFWSSLRGVVGRGFATTGHKTTTVFLNCLASASVSLVVVWPSTVWIALSVAGGTGVLIGMLHVVYASLRYRVLSKHLAEDMGAWWV